MLEAVSPTCSKDRRVGFGRVSFNQNGADSWKPVITLITENFEFSTLDIAFKDVNGVRIDKFQ
jgi:hypothetical protein